MPSSTRWRLLFTASFNAPYVTVAELEMASTIGGTDLCTGGTPSASSFFSAGFEAALAFDNNASTRWNNNGDLASSCWLEYQFPSAVSIVEYRIQTGSSPTSSPSAWRLESWDGSNFVLAETRTGAPAWAASETRTYYAGSITALTPLVYWPLDEASGTTAADASGHGHTATLVNGTWDTSALKKFGAAALANTDTNRGASFTPFSLGTVHTIAFWVNGWNGSNDGIVIGGASQFYGCYLDSTSLYYSAGTSNFGSTTHGGGLTGAHHLVITRNSTAITWYKDAVFVGSTNIGTNTALTVGSLTGYNDGTFGFAATVDDVRVYDLVFTLAQVAELYALVPPAPAVAERADTFIVMPV